MQSNRIDRTRELYANVRQTPEGIISVHALIYTEPYTNGSN